MEFYACLTAATRWRKSCPVSHPGLARYGAKLFLFERTRAGHYPIPFVRDEVVCEMREDQNLTHAVEELAALCKAQMFKSTTPVPVSISYAVARRWYKEEELSLTGREKLGQGARSAIHKSVQFKEIDEFVPLHPTRKNKTNWLANKRNNSPAERAPAIAGSITPRQSPSVLGHFCSAAYARQRGEPLTS